MFLQIHFLTSYHATLLNRDDAGLAKRIVFGGAPRLRVSSQCQKRHWREWLTQQTDLPSGIRSRHIFSRELKRRLVDAGVEEDTAHSLIFHLANGIFRAAGEKDAIDKQTLNMKQPIFFGKPEIDYMFSLLKEAADTGDEQSAKSYLDAKLKSGRQNFTAMVRAAGLQHPVEGLESALFGRFVTSDILSRVDAPVHVAHAFTTHALETEVDFFTVVDDLLQDDETGAAHANDTELGAGIFYGYVAVDVPLLVSNLTGCEPSAWKEENHDGAKDVLNLLVHAIATVSPGAKLGATAPYARAECVVLESGTGHPRSLANAFLHPIRPGANGRHPMDQSVEALGEYLTKLEDMYGQGDEKRAISTLHPWPRAAETPQPLQTAIDTILETVFGGSR